MTIIRTSRIPALLLLAAPLLGGPRFVADSELVDRVVLLVDQRLAVMPEVAAYKFKQGKPVSDPIRERAVLEQSVARAEALHLDGEGARRFFAVQIEMAKGIEQSCLDTWRTDGAHPPRARDLVKEIRPELDRLDQELLPAVYLASPAMGGMPPAALRERLSRRLLYPGIGAERIDRLAGALGALRITAPATWDALNQIGTLRVGTTGDYPPFSEERGGELRGTDIDLARALAQSWGLSVLFVKTSWPTLMADLRSSRFDLAASGVSITPERRREADFSAPYLFEGKMPIARRENAARFASLDGIDRPGVRVIVNPGGTNERFAREHIHRATIVVYPDNRTIFDELVAGRADVMITDGVEVRLQERRHPELVATRAEPFARTGKALLLPSGSPLTERVDAWLKAR